MDVMRDLGSPGHVSHIMGLTCGPIAHRASGVPGFSPPSISINVQSSSMTGCGIQSLGASVRAVPSYPCLRKCQGALPFASTFR